MGFRLPRLRFTRMVPAKSSPPLRRYAKCNCHRYSYIPDTSKYISKTLHILQVRLDSHFREVLRRRNIAAHARRTPESSCVTHSLSFRIIKNYCKCLLFCSLRSMIIRVVGLSVFKQYNVSMRP